MSRKAARWRVGWIAGVCALGLVCGWLVVSLIERPQGGVAETSPDGQHELLVLGSRRGLVPFPKRFFTSVVLARTGADGRELERAVLVSYVHDVSGYYLRGQGDKSGIEWSSDSKQVKAYWEDVIEGEARTMEFDLDTGSGEWRLAGMEDLR